eukprot:11602_1
MPDILVKRTWTLDLLDMATDEEHPDTLKLKQFNKPVDQNWINEAHRDMASRWWRVMSFDFRISIMRLGQELNLSSIAQRLYRIGSLLVILFGFLYILNSLWIFIGNT